MTQDDSGSRRRGRDRRSGPTNPLSRWSLLHGRRRKIRRKQDRAVHFYVDRYGFWAFLVFVLVICLSTLDALITLRLVGAGGQEMNPFMGWALGLGSTTFLAIKYTLTGVSLLFLMVYKEYYFWKGRVPGRWLVLLVLVLYLALICWESLLLMKLQG